MYVTAEADVLLKERSTLITVFGVGTEEERADHRGCRDQYRH